MALVFQWSVSGSKALKPLLRQAAARWSAALSGGPGLLVEVKTAALDGFNGELAETQLLEVDVVTGLPLRAAITVDKLDLKLLLRTKGGRREVSTVLAHELGHSLGYGALWAGKGLSDAAGYLGGGGVREYQVLGGRGDRVPLEQAGGAGTAQVHWSEQSFGRELMTPEVDRGRSPISRMTLGAMEDLGYAVNWSAAEPYNF
jgi:hypothetical protein